MAVNILILEDEYWRRQMFVNELAGKQATRSPWEGEITLNFAETANQAIKLLAEQKFDWIFLDHDLGSEKGDGRTVARNIAENFPLQGEQDKLYIIIHSWNIEKAAEMNAILGEAKALVFRKSFGTELLDMFKNKELIAK